MKNNGNCLQLVAYRDCSKPTNSLPTNGVAATIEATMAVISDLMQSKLGN